MKIELIDHQIIAFPSGSALEFYDSLIYIIGDDATDIYLLHNDLSFKEKIQLFDVSIHRIPKPIKPDFEMSMIKDNFLYAFGSGSVKEFREKYLKYNLVTGDFEIVPFFSFYRQIDDLLGRNSEINLEAMANLDEEILIFNRANNNQPNTIIIVPSDFLKQENFEIKTIAVPILYIENQVAGISGATYSDKSDILFTTISAENTSDTYNDGAIIGSALGICFQPNKQFNSNLFTFDKIINLEMINPLFKNQKIESVCILEENDDVFNLLLVADNDKGDSELFQIMVYLNDFNI